MKKSLFALVLLSSAALGHAVSFTEGFDDLGANGDDFNLSNLLGRGWAESNLSTNPSAFGPYANGDTGEFGSHSGAGYVSTNYQVGNGTLSAWLFTPTITLTNGSTFTFWTRTPDNSFPDRLELRLSTSGSSTNVGASATSTGDFATLLASVNPNLGSLYPTDWTQYTVTLTNLPAAGVDGRLAFRYFVENGGVSGVNGNYIGIDDVSYTGRAVPEPASMAALGLGAFAVLRRRSKRA
jgi:hypothetical protein